MADYGFECNRDECPNNYNCDECEYLFDCNSCYWCEICPLQLVRCDGKSFE